MNKKTNINPLFRSVMEPIADIIGCQLSDRNEQANLRLFVRPNRFYTVSRMSEYRVDHDTYNRFYRDDRTKPFKNGSYVLFTGIMDQEGKCIRRNSPKSMIAFVKGYFLYELLICNLHIHSCYTTEDLSKSLGIDSDTLRRISWRLHQDNVLHINTTDHSRTIKLKCRNKDSYFKIEPYKYETFNNVYQLGYCSTANLSNQINYPIIDPTLSTIYSNQTIFETSASAMPPLFYLAGGTPAEYENLSETETHVVVIEYKLSDYIYDIVSGCLNPVPVEEFISSSPSFSSLYILHRNKDYDGANDTGLFEEETLSEQNIPNYIYVAPYNKLTLDLKSNEFLQGRQHDTYLTWLRKHDLDARITSCHRLWHPFHSLKREFREHVFYNGSRLIEAMDIHNCFYTLLAKRLECEVGPIRPGKYGIPKEEYDRYVTLVRRGAFYEDVMEKAYGDECHSILDIMTECDRILDDVTDYDSPIKTRDKVKTDLQAYRNTLTDSKAKHNYPQIDDYMITQFPYIRRFLFDYKTYEKEMANNGKRIRKEVKCLQRDVCHMETCLISRVCFELQSLGVTPFSLHDGIFVSEADMEKLRDVWGENDIEGAKHHVEMVFWQHFDELQPDKVMELIEGE